MKDFGTTALVCTPSYALHLAEAVAEKGIQRDELRLRLGLFGAEPWSESMRKEIETRLRVSATDNYGLSEVMGPGVSMECGFKSGMHLSEDHFLFEVIDPDTGEVLPSGKTGELVITTLTKEAFPVIRFRTRDLTRLMPEPCPCGRKFMRMQRVMGRTDDMLIIKGVNVFPSQIEAVLFDIEGTEPHYQLVVDRKGALDTIAVHVEVSESIFFDEMKKQNELIGLIKRRLASELGIGVEVKLVEKKTLERSEGKAKRVIDLRKL